MSNNLSLPIMSASQNNKEDTNNDQVTLLDAALTEQFIADLTSADVTLSSLEYQQAVAILADNATVAGREIILPLIQKFIMIRSDAGNTQNVDITVGSTTLVLELDDMRLYYTDGTANGLFEIRQQGIEYLQMTLFEFTAATTIGDGAMYIHIPEGLNNWVLFDVHAQTVTAGVDGTLDIQVHNLTDTVDMLSTKCTVDSNELGSHTAAIPFVVNGANEVVQTNDVLRVDVDAIHTTTAADGLFFTMGFRSP